MRRFWIPGPRRKVRPTWSLPRLPGISPRPSWSAPRSREDFAETELRRARELFAKGTVPQRFVDEAQRAFRSASAAVTAATASLDARDHQVKRALARLIEPVSNAPHQDDCACFTLSAPVDGRVLRVFQKSETVVTPGAPLLEIGDPTLLEVVADFLSADAVRVEPGRPAVIEGWGGEAPLAASVRRVEPFGFTKLSALGIEEQRVNVVFDLVSPRAAVVEPRPRLSGHRQGDRLGSAIGAVRAGHRPVPAGRAVDAVRLQRRGCPPAPRNRWPSCRIAGGNSHRP